MKMGVRLGILALVALAALLVLRWGRGEETSAVAEAPVVAVETVTTSRPQRVFQAARGATASANSGACTMT